MKILSDTKLDFSDVLIVPKRSMLTSRSEPEITHKFHFKNGQTLEGVPVVCANMDTIGNFDIAKRFCENKMFTMLHKHYSINDLVAFFNSNVIYKEFIGITIGTSDYDINKLRELIHLIDLKIICVDVANGYSQTFLSKVTNIRKEFPNHILIAGNVCTPEIVQELVLSGVDIVKVGIGQGSACTTRRIAGIGYPQLSCNIECSDAAHGLGAYIMSDGGCVVPADINKAIGGGADFVMIGGMIAGTDLSSGEIIIENNNKYKLFYGMSSETAMNKYSGGVASYRAAEGKTVKLPYKGSIDVVIQNILGGLRSCMTYIGAKRIKDISKCTTFILVNNQYNTSYNTYVV